MIFQIKPLIGEKAKKKLIQYIKGENWLTEYKYTNIFEKNFAKFVNGKQSICFPNGTLTMTAILANLGLKKSDEVLTSNYTMIATPNSAKLLNYKVSLVDISRKNLCMCPIDLNRKIKKKTKVVIYTHMNGRIGFIKEIAKICKKKNIFLIEDAAHAIGSYVDNKHVGNFGIASSFSFSMPKLITMGQGGAITTNNEKLAKKIRLFKNFGRNTSGNDIHHHLGFNFKITDMQAVIALEQLKDIKKRIEKKKSIFKRYYKNLKSNSEIEIFNFNKGETPWSVDIYSNKIKIIKSKLLKNNILTRNVYPPINTQKIYNHISNLKVSENYCKKGIWLPSSLDITENQIDKICRIINQI